MAFVEASGILNSVLDMLRNRLVDEFYRLTEVGAELKKLEGTLSTIRNVLEDAEAKQVKEKALTEWLRRLKDVVYDIDDLLDDDFAKNRKKSASEGSASWMKGKVSNLLPNSIWSRHKISRKIREIRETLDYIAEDRSKFYLQERSVVTCCRQENVVRELETGPFVIESEVYGREEDKKKIIEFLVDTSGGDLEVIAIVGMGGLGKTTLAQLVYNDQQIKDHFEEKMKIWVCVSDDFDPKRLVGLIIEQITGSHCNLTSMASMESKLKQELEKKRFLLVLDDVWNENDQKWDRLRSLLTIGARGSKVVVTTRVGRIASLMATVEPHFLKGLSEDHCLSLFEKKAFGIGGCEKTANLVTIGKEIVKKCGGVPLAAKVLGSLMSSKEGESEWLAVRDYDSWKSEENDILPALRLSYNHLPSHLKQCFSYCSIFPKDTEIEDETLVQLWIAEGFIRRPNENMKLEDVGYQYLRELLSRSLFEKDTWSECIKMHDLVHDLAQSISGEECSSIDIAGNRREIYPMMIRYSSFIYTKEATPLILDILNEVKKLRTFYFLKSDPREAIRNEDMMLKILETVFSSMKLLRALYLSRYPIKELPMSISNLRHLRYLNLSSSRDLETLPDSIGSLHNLHVLILQGCRSLKELPHSIGNLSNLLTLNLEDCESFVSLPDSIDRLKSLQTLNLKETKIEKLPESLCRLSDLRSINLHWCCSLLELPENMKDMKSLTNLDTGGCNKLTGVPSGIGQLSHLRQLPLFVVSEKSECGLRELNGLNLLEGELDISNLENVKNFQEARDANLIEKHGLNELKLSWGLDTYKRQVEAWVHTDQEGESRQDLIRALALAEKVLEGLQPHQNLRKLKINGYLGKIFPKWLESSSSLPNLVYLCLHSCFRFETLPEISQLHNLRTLYLEKLTAVTLPEISQLHNLRTLYLEKLTAVKSLPPLGHLPYLKELSLKYLLAVKSLGSEFYGTGDGAFPVLEKLSLNQMPELEEWCEASTAGQQRSFPRLNDLTLRNCPKLKVLPSSLPSLENLRLGADYELLLSSIPCGAFQNLKTLYLENYFKNFGCKSRLPQIVAERLTFQSCVDMTWIESMVDADELNFMRSVAGLP